MNKSLNKIALNWTTFLSCALLVISGFIIQINFHIGDSELALGMTRETCEFFHKISSLIAGICISIHITNNYKWYRTVIKNSLFKRNIALTILTLFFIATALSGYAPWVMDALFGTNQIRNVIIEIHDKIGIIFTAFLLIHLQKKIRLIAFRKRTPSTIH